MASSRNRPTTIGHRHTVPNSDYSSFPCYQEKIELKTNLECDHSDSQNVNNEEEIQVNVSMHDKLKMCFAEMENMKNQFDNRRRKVQTKKKAHSNWTTTATTSTSTADRPITSNENQVDQSSAKDKDNRWNEQQKQGGVKRTNIPTFTTSQINEPKLISIDSDEKEHRFQARLIRTSSKDSIEDRIDDHRNKSIVPCQETYEHSKLKYKRRPISEPFGDPILMNQIKKDERLSSQSWLHEQTRARKEYNDWVNKLEEINDMSQSTINRIKNLEHEVMNLKAISNQATSSSNNVKTFTTKRLPVGMFTTNIPQFKSSELNRRYSDKSINTDIDLKFMNELLGKWKVKKTISTQTVPEVPIYLGDAQRRLQPRRLTTTLSRSVEIQTDLIPPNNDNIVKNIKDNNNQLSQRNIVDNERMESISILDMPNVEEQHMYNHPNILSNKSTDFYKESTVKTPEPIIEIHSDSEDTNFEDFEKNIYNEISRRAIINNKIINRKIYDNKWTDSNDLKSFRLKNSSTQTNHTEENVMDEKEATITSTPTPLKQANKSNKTAMMNKKLNTTSKITIERCRYDQKEKSEIVLKTNIDNKGKVHRVTEVKNSKYTPNERNAEKSDKMSEEKETYMKNYDTNDSLRKIYSEMNIYPSDTLLSRPMSENDVFIPEDKNDDNFLTNKAVSSVDISSKSPVVSEGYHSEYIDSNNRMDNYSHRQTPVDDLLLKPPESFHNEPFWEKASKTEVINKTVDEALPQSLDFEYNKNNILTLTNETLVDNDGKKTNITTKSRTIRKYKPNNKTVSMAELPLYCPEEEKHYPRTVLPNHSVSQYNLHELQDTDLDAEPNYNDYQIESNRSKPNMCNVSLVYNYDNNLVFRANFGIFKLPAYETNL